MRRMVFIPGMAVSQTACRFVESPSKVTSMVLPPTSKFSSWRG